MREILFRGKRLDNGEWVYGDIHKNIDFTKSHIHPLGERIRSHDVDPKTVGQYLGKHWKDGSKVFQHDFLQEGIYLDYCSESLSYTLFGNKDYGDIYDGNACYSCNGDIFTDEYNFSEMECIGNIFDNPELLEQK